MATMTTQQKLDEAEEAYHNLMTGTQAKVVVDQNGERVEFTASNASRLFAYIQSLKKLLNPASHITGPARFLF
jgi:hypothetical protein